MEKMALIFQFGKKMFPRNMCPVKFRTYFEGVGESLKFETYFTCAKNSLTRIFPPADIFDASISFHFPRRPDDQY